MFPTPVKNGHLCSKFLCVAVSLKVPRLQVAVTDHQSDCGVPRWAKSMPPGVMGSGDQLVGQKLAGGQNTVGRECLTPSLTSHKKLFTSVKGG